MTKYRVATALILIISALLAFFIYRTEVRESRYDLKLGLDLSGGTHLVYDADVIKVAEGEIEDAMQTLRDVIERRVNLFGVSEPIVQTESGLGVSGEVEHRLIIELPGVTDINEAIRRIGETPTLEFKLQKSDTEAEALIESFQRQNGTTTDPELLQDLIDDLYTDTGLTGRFLSRAQVVFDPTTNAPIVQITFNDEGAALFEKITRENKGKILSIFLDGVPISEPVIQEEIKGGTAVITGSFTAVEAKDLARNLNYGALPLPIELVNTQTIGPSLGRNALTAGVKAGIAGFVLVALFMILWYRLPGLIAVISLITYLILSIAFYKLFGITITAAGLAGLVLSLGIAIDANVLIFERYKEGHAKGIYGAEGWQEAFSRAWLAIRDGNVTGIISAVVLYYSGTFLTQSFALTLGLGIIISMFTAITITRTFLLALNIKGVTPTSRFLLGNGINLTPKA